MTSVSESALLSPLREVRTCVTHVFFSLFSLLRQVHTLQAIALMEFNFNSTTTKGTEVGTAQDISRQTETISFLYRL